MILAHGYPLATTDVDAVPHGWEIHELDHFIKTIAKELHLPGDWLNPHFSTFLHVLPKDFSSRVKAVYQGQHLRVDALGVEEMLLLKCFAHRPKDIPHARALLRLEPDLSLIERRIDELKKLKIPGTSEAADFLDDLLDQVNS